MLSVVERGELTNGDLERVFAVHDPGGLAHGNRDRHQTSAGILPLF